MQANPIVQPVMQDPKLHALGSELLGHLFSALKTLQVHDVSNSAVASTVTRLTQLLRELAHTTDGAQLVFLEDDAYVNGQRIRVIRAELPRYVSLVREFKRIGLVRIDVRPNPTELDVRRALNAIIHPGSSNERREELGTVVIEFARDSIARLPEHLFDRRQYALRVYAKAVLFLQEFAGALNGQRAPPIRKAYRLVQDLVDIGQADVLPLLGLSTIRDHNDTLFHHSVNVAILSIAMGQRLKMPKQALAELGMAGLLHDLGKLTVPTAVMRKQGQLSAEERKYLDRIPLETVRILTHHDAICSGHAAQLILAYEHHLVRSVNDYVRLFGREALYFESQILSIVNHYDALTTARPQRGPYLPDQALRMIMEEAGTRFDPILVQVFANLLGRYPISTLAVLSDGTMAVVVHTVPDEPRRPLVKVVLDAKGTKIDGPYVDLAADAENRTIVGSANPYEYKINVVQYLMF
jgi:HD-GYP domain-containing protein (c-di-GMP phosphodiesterase class II)